jgi:hypothetical protein
MSKERYNQIIDVFYKNYLKNCLSRKWMKKNFFFDGSFNHHLYLREEFIHKCKTDQEFSERWGLKIEGREMSLEERNEWSWENWGITCEMESVLDEQEVPKRVITLEYNGEKIEVYE